MCLSLTFFAYFHSFWIFALRLLLTKFCATSSDSPMIVAWVKHTLSVPDWLLSVLNQFASSAFRRAVKFHQPGSDHHTRTHTHTHTHSHMRASSLSLSLSLARSLSLSLSELLSSIRNWIRRTASHFVIPVTTMTSFVLYICWLLIGSSSRHPLSINNPV